jgi:hypothetical protein
MSPVVRRAAEPFGEALREIHDRVRIRELAPERATERIFARLEPASRVCARRAARAEPATRIAAPS